MAEKEYIERGSFRRELIDRQITTQFFNPIARNEIGCIVEMLDNKPAADVVEVRHGRYIPDMRYRAIGNCSLSNADLKCFDKYCPNCGAKLDGMQTEETTC